MEKNAGEWTGRVEISKEEIPGSMRSMYDCILSYSRLESLSSVNSPDGALISASAAPHAGGGGITASHVVPINTIRTA